ncbi:uncharacterized protein SCHCODRAFT_02750661 [Schizophyllum commune H4-8]|uniref:C2H2-type domain-containing protein n=1 Tax=Schizophyllum commune (strain H4-8 / FGSC 9210) TaxID=578458 RepID=D8QB47_SCHCM|nr:uncharacterized protein SCHCODRAFT_02750661 [Schizophyllum commune H4-8]KAI5889032.1 hypothetical protein SCHCODRAFT_02750661 [Schizophyllum commune H4-8]
MSGFFLQNDSEPDFNEDGSPVTVFVDDVDIGKGEVYLAPRLSPSSIMARSVIFHNHRLLELIDEKGLSPACEILMLRLQQLTDRAKAHIQRQLTYASNCKLYLDALNSGDAVTTQDIFNGRILDEHTSAMCACFLTMSDPHAWGVESMADIMKPIDYRIVYPEVPAAPTTAPTVIAPDATGSASLSCPTSRGSKRSASGKPSAAAHSHRKRSHFDSVSYAIVDASSAHLSTAYATYYVDPDTKHKKRARSDAEDEGRAPKRQRELSDAALTPSLDDLSDTDADGEEDDEYSLALTPEVVRPSSTPEDVRFIPACDSTTHEPHPVAGCGPRTTGIKTLAFPMSYHTALPLHQADVDEPVPNEAPAADEPVSDDDSGSVYEPPSSSPAPLPRRNARRSRLAKKPYDRPATTKSRASTQKSRSRTATSASSTSRASSSRPSRVVPKDAAASVIGTNVKIHPVLRRIITPVDAPGHINLGFDNADPELKGHIACSICPAVRDNLCNLSRHIVTHLKWGAEKKNGPYQCLTCRREGYAREDAFERHLRNHPKHKGWDDTECSELWIDYNGVEKHFQLDVPANH